MANRYAIGGEYKIAVIFTGIYFVLGLLFADIKVSVIITVLFFITIALNWRGWEAPLAIYIRTVHIIFIGLVLFSLLKAF